ncbi:MAG TPA: hypothetical protein VHQ95_18590 [Pyrinomonadaceae bacterium]|jgi:hypothetical protein|nr:hypothetical protein [Pyrinomonadaceae bacterium]
MPARKTPTSGKAKAGKAKTTKAKTVKAKVAPGKCSGWKAILNMMPPGPSILRVTGKCIFPKHGFKVTLKEAVPQGINPAILLLKKTVKPPTGIVIPTPQVVNVTFTKKTTFKYQKVTILPDGVTINVQIVV